MQPVAEQYNLDGVLTLVDAKHIGQHLDEEKPEGVVNEALAQVAYADRIILNKIDLVSLRKPSQVGQMSPYLVCISCRADDRADVLSLRAFLRWPF
jgi:G3E family GTPase